jgi:ATP-dependent Lon protease
LRSGGVILTPNLFRELAVNIAVLPLSDMVVLPGMVVPLPLDDHEVRAAVEAAQLGQPDVAEVALVPRLEGRYGTIGTLARVEQVGRLPGGQPGAIVRGIDRIRIGTGTTSRPRPAMTRPRSSWPGSTRAW